MPALRISSFARASRCPRSALLIGGGMGIDGVASAAWASTRLHGTVSAAATAPAPAIIPRLEILGFMLSPPYAASAASSLTSLAATTAVMPLMSRVGLYSTTSAPTIGPGTRCSTDKMSRTERPPGS